MTMDYKQFIKWTRERDKAVRSLDVETFRKFWSKWEKKGVYAEPLPEKDMIIEITMRKILAQMESATAEEREGAKKWLMDRGMNASWNKVGR